MPDKINDYFYSQEVLRKYLKNGFLFLYQGYETVLKTKRYKLSEQSKNLENDIRDDILRVAEARLKEESLRNRENKLLEFKFKNEPRNISDEDDTKRIDIELIFAIPAYIPDLIIECKRLKNNEKNLAYINNGVQRFVIGRYSEELPIAGMIGFIEAGNEVDIINDLKNRLSKQTETISTIETHTTDVFSEEYAGHIYQSTHSRKGDLSEIELFHLMLDFCEIIEP